MNAVHQTSTAFDLTEFISSKVKVNLYQMREFWLFDGEIRPILLFLNLKSRYSTQLGVVKSTV